MSNKRKIFYFGGADALLTGVTTHKLVDYIYCREPDQSFLETILQTLGLRRVPESVCPTSCGVILIVFGWIVLQIIVVIFYRKNSVLSDTVVRNLQHSKSNTSSVTVVSPFDANGASEKVRTCVSEGEIYENESVDIVCVKNNVIDLSSSSHTAGYASDDRNTDTVLEVESSWIESARETSNVSVSNIVIENGTFETSEKDSDSIQEKDILTESIQASITKDVVEEMEDKVFDSSGALQQNPTVWSQYIEENSEDSDDNVEYASDFAEGSTESDEEVLWIPKKTSADEGSPNEKGKSEWSQPELHCLDVRSVKEGRETLIESVEKGTMQPENIGTLRRLEETSVNVSCQNPTENNLLLDVQLVENKGETRSFPSMRNDSDFGYTSDISDDDIAHASEDSGSETDAEVEAIWLSSLAVEGNTESSSPPHKDEDECKDIIHEVVADSKRPAIENMDTDLGDEIQLSIPSSESALEFTESSFSNGVDSTRKESLQQIFTEDIDPDDEYLVRCEESDESEDETDVLNQGRRLPTLDDDFEDLLSAPFESPSQTDPNLDLFKNVPKCVGCGSYFATWRLKNCAACRKPPRHPNICSIKKNKNRC
ncbi:uncharacterized protein LOC133201041 [Saccostrea echinata]|uniref:uncharacterized protein LOC133201041 n=1 Tax=Saccostrea echinata TaxID=191078 RepID=UPI002A7FD9F8|nr:uncharacterized protein LOC133201041 [Saccostrea echinata]